MSKNKKLAEQFASFLKSLASKIEENPEYLKEFISQDNDTNKTKEKLYDFDVFQVYSDGGEEALKGKLYSLELPALVSIVRKHSLDPSKLAEKWKNKERLVNFIVERVTSRSERGKVFKQYP